MAADIPGELTTELRNDWQRCLPGQEELGDGLIARYTEPQRRYHGRRHLAEVLRRVEELAGDDHDLLLVRLAAWYHDAVYDIPPRQVSNEEASARLAIRELGRVGLETEDLNEVARLIRLTTSHKPGPHDANGELLCDADLGVLAGSASDYDWYRTAIRAEYAGVSDQEFAQRRLEVLSALLDAGIFRTAGGRKLERAAIDNVTVECRTLASQLGLPVEMGPVEKDGAGRDGAGRDGGAGGIIGP